MNSLPQAFIEIELTQNTPYYTGGCVEGNIHLYGKDNINDVKEISLTLTGFESVEMKTGKGQGSKQANPIVNHAFSVYDYDDFHNVIQKGSYTYPFQLYLDEILP